MCKYSKKAMLDTLSLRTPSAYEMGWFSFSSDSVKEPRKISGKEVYFLSLPLKEQEDIRKMERVTEYYEKLFGTK